MDRFAAAVMARSGWVLAAVLGLTVLATLQVVNPRTGAVRLDFDSSLARLLPAQGPERAFFARIQRQFGSRDTLFVPLIGDPLFTAENLATVKRISERFEALPGVHRVVSLATTATLRTVGDELLIEPFLDSIPQEPAALARLRDEALANPLLVDNLVGRDAQATAILIELSPLERGAPEVDLAAEAILAEERGALEAYVLGGPRVTALVGKLLLADVLRLLPLAFIAVAFVALLAFRSLRGVLVPASTIAIALIWTLGSIAALGGSLNLVTTLVPVLVVTVGFAYAIHLLTDFEAHARAEEPHPEPARAALARECLPIVLTGITTGVGFLSLTLSRLDAIRDFGLYAVIGVACSVAATLTYMPALLHRLPAPRPRPAHASRFDRFALWLGDFDLRHRRAILIGWALFAALSVGGMAQIRVGTDVIGSFPPDSPLRQQYDVVERHFGGANGFYVVVQAGEREGWKQPANLRALREFQDWLAEQPDVGGSSSLVDYLMLVNRGLHEDDPAHFAIPESRRLVTQLLFFAGGDALDRFVDSRFETAVVAVRSKTLESGALAAQIAAFETRLAELPEPLHATVTGNPVFAARAMNEISRGQTASLGVAFIGIYLILSLVFASPRVGALALIPNALPVIAYFGILGLSGISLNATTGLVACMVLGIAVDDTIHFLVRFNQEARQRADERGGAIEALRTTGRPVTYTTLALCSGLLVLTGSQLRNQVEFGALAAATLAVAWLVDVVLTPALASRMRIVTLWDVLTLDLGENPQQSIPVFRGMSVRQARLTAVLTHIHSRSAGERLLVQGRPSDDLYVVVDGRLEMTARDSLGETHRSGLERGEVVGAEALFAGLCTADVAAATDVRLLQFSRHDLASLLRRYPRTAGRFHRNLSNVLLGRIEPLGRDERMRLMQFVCSFAWADQAIQPEERGVIERLVGRLDLDPSERLQVARWLRDPDAAGHVEPELVPRQHRVLFVEAIAALVLADGEIAEQEIELFRPILS